MNGILSTNDVLWRTTHGYAALLMFKDSYVDKEFFEDLTTICSDVSKARAIAKPAGLTFLRKDAIPDNELMEVKAKYRRLENYLEKKLGGKANEKDFEEAIQVAGSLMKYFKQKL